MAMNRKGAISHARKLGWSKPWAAKFRNLRGSREPEYAVGERINGELVERGAHPQSYEAAFLDAVRNEQWGSGGCSEKRA
jgi:hypothetical protein